MFVASMFEFRKWIILSYKISDNLQLNMTVKLFEPLEMEQIFVITLLPPFFKTNSQR